MPFHRQSHLLPLKLKRNVNMGNLGVMGHSGRKLKGRAKNARSGKLCHRSAAVILELILTLPILMIALAAIVEFGLLLNNLQYVESASRAGVQVASRLSAASLNTGSLDASVLTAVNQELSNISPGVVARQVYLEHNVNPAPPPTVGATVMVCDGASSTPCPFVTVTAPSAPSTEYVRVTVFVDFPDVAPNALAYFGLDFENSIVQQTTTRMWFGP